jgi:ATP-dependent DNA helicase RecG
MNKDELLKLVKDGESLLLEFKSDRGPLPDDEMLEVIVCLANHNGGHLLVGVEDNGEITGLHKKHQSAPGALAGFIASRTVPPISVEVHFIDISDKKVAVIQVPSARQVVATSDGKLTVRFMDAHGKPGCRPLYPHELINWQAERGNLDPSAMPIIGATWVDLDPLEFTRLRRMVDENHGDSVLLDLPDLDVAKALGFVKTEQEVITPTLAGLLLVGKETALVNIFHLTKWLFKCYKTMKCVSTTFTAGRCFVPWNGSWKPFRFATKSANSIWVCSGLGCRLMIAVDFAKLSIMP